MSRARLITANRSLAIALANSLAQGGLMAAEPTTYQLESRGSAPEPMPYLLSGLGKSREELRQQRQQAKHSPKMQKMALKSRR